jgi:hypothetical protein
VARADGIAVVLDWVRAAPRPVEARTGRVRPAGEVVAELLEHRAGGLAAYPEDLAGALAGPRAALGEAAVACLARAWCHRRCEGGRSAGDPPAPVGLEETHARRPEPARPSRPGAPHRVS